ncbi:MAG: SEC-C domain-containing protein [Coriobacteriaceae bacterium]|nr:SEC-C domain-containing protein [Coriobacteriaceae bacterium]
MVSKAIEGAQRQVESMHFAARKNVLEYDDVMNLQRSAIYGERNAILDGKDITDRIPEIISESADAVVVENCPEKVPSDDWDLKAVNTWVADISGNSDFSLAPADCDGLPHEVTDAICTYLEALYKEKAQMLGGNALEMLQAQVMLRIIDVKWMAHLHEMDYLKTGIQLRAFGQRDPLVEYKNEAYDAFQTLTSTMYEDFLRTLLRLQVAAVQAPEERSPLEGKVSYSSPEAALTESSVSAQAASSMPLGGDGVPAAPPAAAIGKAQTYVKDKDDLFANAGRNDPCPCGSGKKYKKCCGANA